VSNAAAKELFCQFAILRLRRFRARPIEAVGGPGRQVNEILSPVGGKSRAK
jgi:hypothetical protein